MNKPGDSIGLEEMFVRLAKALSEPDAENRYLVDDATLRALIGVAAVGVESLALLRADKQSKARRGRRSGSRTKRLELADNEILDKLEKLIRDQHQMPISKLLSTLIGEAQSYGALGGLATGSHEKRLRSKWKERNENRPQTMSNILMFAYTPKSPKPGQ